MTIAVWSSLESWSWLRTGLLWQEKKDIWRLGEKRHHQEQTWPVRIQEAEHASRQWFQCCFESFRMWKLTTGTDFCTKIIARFLPYGPMDLTLRWVEAGTKACKKDLQGKPLGPMEQGLHAPARRNGVNRLCAHLEKWAYWYLPENRRRVGEGKDRTLECCIETSW